MKAHRDRAAPGVGTSARMGAAPGRVAPSASLPPTSAHAPATEGADPTAGLLPEVNGGDGLPRQLRARFEESLGVDLGAVRVHTDGPSAEAAAAVGARAFAVGDGVHFGPGQYRPDDPFGQHLIAHEVAHTIQQRGAAAQPAYKLEVSQPSDPAEREADRAADAMVSGRRTTVSASPIAVMRQAKPPAAAPTPGDELDKSPIDYPKAFAALNNLNMLQMLQRLDARRAKLPDLLQHLDNPDPGTRRIRAAILAVQLKGASTESGEGAARMKKLQDELAAAKVAVWERADVGVYLEGSAGRLRRETLDELAAQIDAGIASIKEVELLEPEKQKGSTLEKDREQVRRSRDRILRLVHDYMRLVDAELVTLTGADLGKRTEQKKRFDHFKMMREIESLSKTMIETKGPTEFAAAYKRKGELDAKIADPAMSFRKPIGTNGLHDGRVYVVYEDHVKIGGDPAWVNNNPGNVIANKLATNMKNNFQVRKFAIFINMELGFQGIPTELKSWRQEKPGHYTILRTFQRWANGKTDNPDVYATAVVIGMNKEAIKANGQKITKETLLDDLTDDALFRMGQIMGKRVERMDEGDIYRRSDVKAQPWIGPLLGVP